MARTASSLLISALAVALLWTAPAGAEQDCSDLLQERIVDALANDSGVEAEVEWKREPECPESADLDGRIRLSDNGEDRLPLVARLVGRDGGTERTWVLGSLLTFRVSQVFAGERLGRDQTLEPADLHTETVSKRPGSFVLTTVEDAAGQRTRMAIEAGDPVRPSVLAPPVLVERDEVVELSFASRGFDIALKVKALRDGERGEEIPVRNPSSGRRFTVRVAGDGVVEVIGNDQ